MGHPIFQDVPSRDMTKAQERQFELEAQIEAFLAKGGEIKAYDNFCRPAESSPWRSKSINPSQQKPAEAVPVKVRSAKPSAPLKDKPAPTQEVVLENIDISGELLAVRKQVAALKRRLNRLCASAGGRT